LPLAWVEFRVLHAMIHTDIISVHIASMLLFRCSGIITSGCEVAAAVITFLLSSNRILQLVQIL